MAKLSEEYSKIIKNIEENISDENEKKYVLSKVSELASLYMDIIDRVTSVNSDRMDELEKYQDQLEQKLDKVKETVDLIKKDIYEDEDYDFEIVCPYCNHEFVANIEDELKEEIECPECHNVIELDWNEEHCSGSCSHCMENCVQEDDETYNTNEKDTKKKEDKDNNEDDEDM